MQNRKLVIFSVLILLGLFFIGGYLYKNSKQTSVTKISDEQAWLLQKPYSFVIGNKNAKVQLVEFFDPACGACAYFYEKVEKLMKEKDGKIKLVLRYAPFHKNSNYAVKMLEGAREQGLFIETLEYMFKTQSQWIENHVVNPQKLWALLPNIKGLDMDKLAFFMNEDKADEIIRQDLEDVEKLKIDKTPSYFVNGEELKVFGWDNLVKLIDSHL
ncbi:disulfide bond formation protein DsbA [Halarcobacter ebronensis]|uniref:Disulfide bond formation protein DsbA n=1 Tax=Halarcobacter ebronensis TaxID=1462615 RepID=A0A4Q0Y8Y1_9BACT|nr:thioredoxin domain-containing protein [Halarcobacter ebronensis]RXJ66295.1 disulfide bond formation protein DsbA [Halarcobacter ebronensis]